MCPHLITAKRSFGPGLDGRNGFLPVFSAVFLTGAWNPSSMYLCRLASKYGLHLPPLLNGFGIFFLDSALAFRVR